MCHDFVPMVTGDVIYVASLPRMGVHIHGELAYPIANVITIREV